MKARESMMLALGHWHAIGGACAADAPSDLTGVWIVPMQVHLSWRADAGRVDPMGSR